jgi:adenine/guanine phosphoribosyltransferase-like PRPP-binding protein
MMPTVYSNGTHLIAPNDNLATLKNCQGYYSATLDADGKPTSSVVGYSGSYEDTDGQQQKWVGLTYYNFSKADQWPEVLTHFAKQMATSINAKSLFPSMIVGAPWAGVKFSQEVARLLGCRHIFAEKKGDDLILGRYEDEIPLGASVLIGEELVNNASTTDKLISLIEGVGGRVIGIFCAINRSYPFADSFTTADGRILPIMGVVEKSTPQYKQDNSLVSAAIAEGRVVWKPKYGWTELHR